jgi:hypothetical protein
MNRWTKFCLAVVTLLSALSIASAPLPASAGTAEHPDVYVDGERLQFDVQPQVVQGRTLVPMRMIFESLGAEVRWEADTATALASLNGVELRLPIGKQEARKNGVALPLDVPAQLIGNRTMVPVRFIAEAFGSQVEWFGEDGYVKISGGKEAPPVRVIGADPAVVDGQAAELMKMVKDHRLIEQVEQTAGLKFQGPVWVYLANSEPGYVDALRRYASGKNAAELAKVAEGLAYDNHVILPMHKNETPEELRMTLTHELLHVLINQNGGALQVPSWINEGLAWRVGIEARYASEPPVMRERMEGWIRKHVLDAYLDGAYQPLIGDPFDKLDALSGVSYNVELQDYLACKVLLQKYGEDAMRLYLREVASGRSGAFVKAFGVTEQEFERQFQAYLQTELGRKSQGLEVTVKVDDSFAGKVYWLPQGASRGMARELKLVPGTHTIRFYKDGRVEGVRTVSSTLSATRDEEYVYWFVKLDGTVYEQGVTTREGGAVFQEGYGEYSFSNVWLESTDGQSVYPQSNRLMGLEVLQVRTIL